MNGMIINRKFKLNHEYLELIKTTLSHYHDYLRECRSAFAPGSEPKEIWKDLAKIDFILDDIINPILNPAENYSKINLILDDIDESAKELRWEEDNLIKLNKSKMDNMLYTDNTNPPS